MTKEEFRNTKEYKRTYYYAWEELSKALNELIDEVLKLFEPICIPIIKFLDRKIKCFTKKF